MSPARAAGVGIAVGVAVAVVLAAVLVPRLVWLGSLAEPWRVAVAMAGVACALWAMRWNRMALAPLTASLAGHLTRRRAAHDIPFRLARGGFGATVACGAGTTVALAIAGADATTALVAGVVTYLLLVLPVLGVYLWVRRALRSEAAGRDAGDGALGGLRQTVGMRLAFALQLPVAVCAAGIVLMEQSSGATYAADVATYHRERYATLLGRTLRALPDPTARAELARAVRLPDGVTLEGGDPRADAVRIAPGDGRDVRPWSLRLPPLLLLGLITLLAAWLGRRLADEVTTELDAVRGGLRGLRTPEAPGMPGERADAALGTTVALQETEALVEAFRAAVAGFEQQRAALRLAASNRRSAELAKARFLAHLSHELKSPLNSILGFAELLLAEIDGPLTPRQRDQIAIVWRSGESLLRFILALLDLARLEGPGAQELETSAVRADALAAAVRAQLRPDPLASVRVIVPEPADPDRACRADGAATARALVLAAGVLLDAAERGEVEIEIIAGPDGGLDAHVRAISLDADETDRVRLIEQVSTARRRWSPEDDERFGATAATLMLLRRLAEVLDGRFSAVNEGWPRFTLSLPAA